MKTHSTSRHVGVLLVAAFLTLFALPINRLHAFPIITNVVETGGDNEPGDTVTAKWTGVTWTDHAAGEPVPGLAAGAPYTVGLFGNWAPGFVDRNHRYTNASRATEVLIPLPPYLVGQEYIMSGNDNRDNNLSPLLYRLDVFVSQPVIVYMLIDNRLGAPNSSNADPPSFGPTKMQWILDEGWVPVITGLNRAQNMSFPDEVGFDESADNTHNQWFSVYRKLVTTGSFQLKQADNDGQNMYGVVVAPAFPPAVPTNLVAVAGDTKVQLYWSASGGANSYIIKRSLIAGGPYDNIATNSSTGYLDTGLVNAVTYYYVVSAVGSGGESSNSVEVAATPRPAPANVVATGGTNQVQLTWDPFSGAASYTVKRSDISGGPYTTIASGILPTSYLDTTVQSGRTYYYVIVAQLSGGGDSGQSDQAAGTTAPGAPTGLTASLWAATAIRLAWNTTDPVVTGYSIEASTDGISFVPITTVPATPRNYVDAFLSASTTYFYRIQATNSGGNSGYSNIASNSTPSGGWNVNFANATNGMPANNLAPTPPGYVQDVGEIFADRGNGYSYGWDRDITADSRWRMNAASPDLRYDTFNHFQKIPVPSATWNLQIPNGFYWVHIVSGDPTALDSIFQHDIEGVRTRTYVPVTGAWWGEFTNTVLVRDGQLTVTSGPNTYGLANTNNKINFIDIYPAEAIPVAIDQQPQTPVTVTEFRPASLSVTVTNVPFTPTTPFYGAEPIFYQWYQNDAPVTRGTNATLSFPLAQTSDSGNYYVIVSNYAGSATSQVAVLTVNEDMEAPQVVSVASADGLFIGVCFNELLDLHPDPLDNAALDRFNYFINGNNQLATNVTMRPDGRSVLLALEVPLSGPFTVRADVPDAAGNVASSASGSSTVLGFTAGDVGGPPAPGSHYTCDSNVIEVVGGGGDIWSTADQMHFVSKPVTGDFDVKVRVEALSLPATAGPGTIAKAALLARETTAANSRGLHISVNPLPPGRNQGEAGQRPTTGGATVAWHTNSYTPAAIPNAWMRMTRVGNTFTGYRSTNGIDWIQFAQTNQSYPLTMVLGLGVTAHTNAALVATGLFSNFMLTQPAADMSITKVDIPDPVGLGVAPSNITYTITVTNHGPDNASIATVSDPLPAGVNFVSATPSQGSCSNVSGTVSCNLGAIASGGSATVTIVVTPTVAGIVTNTATVLASAVDLSGGNNSASAVTRVLTPTRMVSLSYSGGTFMMSFATASGLTYLVQYKNDLNDLNWTNLTMITGDGSVRTITDPGPAQPMRFYRVRID